MVPFVLITFAGLFCTGTAMTVEARNLPSKTSVDTFWLFIVGIVLLTIAAAILANAAGV